LFDYAEANSGDLKEIPKDSNSNQEKKQTKEIARERLDKHCKNSIELFGKYLCLKKWI
jgi:riboflavin synthase